MSELIIVIRDFNGHVGIDIDGFHGLMEDLVLAKEIRRVGFCMNLAMQSAFASPTHGLEWLTRKDHLWLRM